MGCLWAERRRRIWARLIVRKGLFFYREFNPWKGIGHLTKVFLEKSRKMFFGAANKVYRNASGSEVLTHASKNIFWERFCK
jgi:hypothetical protein